MVEAASRGCGAALVERQIGNLVLSEKEVLNIRTYT